MVNICPSENRHETHDSCCRQVGAAGFEPTTSPTRTVHATGLRHAPTINQYSEVLC